MKTPDKNIIYKGKFFGIAFVPYSLHIKHCPKRSWFVDVYIWYKFPYKITQFLFFGLQLAFKTKL